MAATHRMGHSANGTAVGHSIRRAVSLLALAALAASASTHLPVVMPILPENPMAFAGCTAQVNVDAARLRRAPSVVAQILGLRFSHDKLKVTRVLEGKWAAVEFEGGEAYLAAYLLDFPRQEFLDQWKKEGPTTSPALGKRARVKWASLPFRRYPDSASVSAGLLRRGAVVSRLIDLGDGWALVRGGGNRLGFLPAEALEVFQESWAAALPLTPLEAEAEAVAAEAVLLEEEPIGRYAWRTAWSPAVFAAGDGGGFGPGRPGWPPEGPSGESPAQYLARTAWSPEFDRAERRWAEESAVGQAEGMSAAEGPETGRLRLAAVTRRIASGNRIAGL